MKSKFLLVVAILAVVNTSIAQKSKVQAAWRALNDYESTLLDGKPDLNYLNKAKEAIDVALTNEDTKHQGKTYAYKARIMYNLYKSNFNAEFNKLGSIADKDERTFMAYGNTSTVEFEAANDAVNKIKDEDPKYMQMIQDGIAKGGSSFGEDDSKFVLVATQLKLEAGNIAYGKYKLKKFDEAADYFYKQASLNYALTQKKDTSNYKNACTSASKAKNNAKILEYNKKMMDLNIASPFNYQAMFAAYMESKDTTAAVDMLKKGRASFPDDVGLLNSETNIYLAQGKPKDAISNIDAVLAKDPNNVLYYMVRGDLYNGLAFPTDKATGKDLDRPADFEELFGKAEQSYLKVIELKPTNKEYLQYSLFMMGAIYNNNGKYYQTKSQNVTLTELKTKGKEYEAKYLELFKKAIPYLEQSLELKSEDRECMVALRKLYNYTGDAAKSAEMNAKIKALK